MIPIKKIGYHLSKTTAHKVGCSSIKFPKQPYNFQVRMMQTIQNAIKKHKSLVIQSPTGTGKTLCLLSATLEAVYSPQSQQKIQRIYYLTRTHSQISGIMKQLQQTSYQPNMTILQSKKSLCINEDILQKGQRLNNESFNQLCKQSNNCQNDTKSKKCSKIKQMIVDNQVNELTEKFGKKYAEKVVVSSTVINYPPFNVMSSQDQIKKHCKNQNYCPYYYTNALKKQAEVIIIPYIYLLNPSILNSKQFNLSNSVIIFDEAHNVLSQAKQFYGISINMKLLQKFRQQIDLLEQQSSVIIELLKYYQKLKELINKTKRSFDQQKKSFSLKSLKQLEIIIDWNIFSDFINWRQQNQKAISQLGLKISMKKLNKDFQKHGVNKLQKQNKKVKNIPVFLNVFINLIERLANLFSDQKAQNMYICALYKQSMIQKPNKQQFKIRFHCLSSKIAFDNLKSNNTSFIFASGTIRNIQFLQTQLDFHNPFSILYETQNPYNLQNVQQYQITKYRNRSLNINYRDDNIKEVAYLLSQLIPSIPDGVLVFFKSSRYMHQFKEYVENQGIKMGNKPCFYQQNNFSQTLNRYKQQCQSGNGAILFGYMRGKASQGCNFKDHLARAVFIIGLPLSNYMSIQTKIQQKHMNRSQFNQWYIYDAMKAVNQGIGRVLRHQKDFGLVYLIGKKLCQQSHLLPNWLKKSKVNYYNNIQSIKSESSKFFQDKMLKTADKNIQEEQQIFIDQSLQTDLFELEQLQQNSNTSIKQIKNNFNYQ